METGKSVLDLAVSIISRGDVDRAMLLFHMNSSIRAAFRSRMIYRLQKAQSFPITSGLVSCPTLKIARHVRFIDGSLSSPLVKIPDIKQLYEMYADPSQNGNPAHYSVQGQTVQVIPAPFSGTLLIAGEFWPVDLTDSLNSSNIFSDEIPDFLVNYGAAEYLDFLQEEKRGKYYRDKAIAILDQWIKENRMQEMTGVNNMPRDPLGNLGYNRRTRAIENLSDGPENEVIDDAGVW